MPQDFKFLGNASLFNVLITNIISNAITYNVNNGSVLIGAIESDGLFQLSISDTGIGMKQEEIDKTFGRFSKLSNGDENSHGLGLTIVKHFADFHQIQVVIASVPDQGTEVTLKFKA